MSWITRHADLKIAETDKCTTSVEIQDAPNRKPLKDHTWRKSVSILSASDLVIADVEGSTVVFDVHSRSLEHEIMKAGTTPIPGLVRMIKKLSELHSAEWWKG